MQIESSPFLSIFRSLILFVTIFLVQTNANAETLLSKEDSNSDDNQKNQLSIGIEHKSNNAAFGQVNSEVIQPVTSPFVGYTAIRGFLGSAYLNHIGNSDSTETKATNELELSLGYTFSFLKDSFTIVPTFVHNFTNQNSQSLTSLVKNQFMLDFTYEFKHVTTSIGSTFLQGESTDFMLVGTVAFPIIFENFLSKNGELSIEPAIGLNFGKQKYIQNLKIKYIQNILDNIRKKHPLFDPTIGQIKDAQRRKKLEAISYDILGVSELNNNETFSDFIENLNNATSSKFSLTSITLTLPVTYSYKNFDFNFSINTNKPTVLAIRNGKNIFLMKNLQLYTGISIAYNFGW